MLWEIDIHPAEGQPDRAGERVAAAARELGLATNVCTWRRPAVISCKVKSLDRAGVERLAAELLTDPVVERAVIGRVGESQLNECNSLMTSARECNHRLRACYVCHGTFEARRDGSRFAECADGGGRFGDSARGVCHASQVLGGRAEFERNQGNWRELLANDAIEQIYFGPLSLDQLELGRPYRFERRTTPVRELDDAALMRLSREGQLYLQLAEMQTIRQHFRDLGREPTDVELETIAQTWSEHCSHKTLAGRIAYRDENGERHFDNMLKETIFAATQTIRERLGRR